MSELTFREWKHECAKFVLKALHIDNLLDEDDPYDVFDTMEDAYENEISPEDWAREAFEEDFAKIAYDADLRETSLEEDAAEEDDDDDEDDDDYLYEDDEDDDNEGADDEDKE